MKASERSMTVFHLYLAMIRKNAGYMLMYFAIFMTISVMITRSQGDVVRQMFAKSAVGIAVTDRDESVISKGLIDFLAQENEIIPSDGNETELTRKLYYREAVYVLTIPEGFGESLTDTSSEPQLEVVKLPGNAAGYYLDADIEQFLSRVGTYLAAGYEEKEAVEKVLALKGSESEVRIAEGAYDYDHMPEYAYTFNYYPYLYLAVLIFSVSFVLKAFREKQVADRLKACPIPERTQALQGLVAFCLVFVVFWVLSILILLAADGTDFFFSPHRGWFLLNSFLFLMVAASIAFFIGNIAKSEIAITALTNVISLGMCFLGGVFVSLDVLNENVQRFSRFLPVWWYVRVCNMLGMRQGGLNTADLSLIRQSFLIQGAFAAALLMLTLYIIKKRSEKA
ncbi:MAG: ABC transporter permease [Lachnospiraceae bacterium]|nr:ABC transporter permease [Lachnospiraceae bacterium]